MRRDPRLTEQVGFVGFCIVIFSLDSVLNSGGVLFLGGVLVLNSALVFNSFLIYDHVLLDRIHGGSGGYVGFVLGVQDGLVLGGHDGHVE